MDCATPKKLSPGERASWSSVLRQVALAWGLGYASEREIDLHGILPTRLAPARSFIRCAYPPTRCWIASLPDEPTPQTP
jgi:hypothetical protein